MVNQKLFFLVAVVAGVALILSLMPFITDSSSSEVSNQITANLSPMFDELIEQQELQFSKVNTRIDELNTKIEDINDTLSLDSEQHRMRILNIVGESVVAVISYPSTPETGGFTSVHYVSTTDGLAYNVGAGFSINQKGHILTAAHVVDDATMVKIVLANGTEIPVSTASIAYGADLAVLMVESGMPPVNLSDNPNVNVGSDVGFIGFPLGPDARTKTLGAISAIAVHEYIEDTTVPIYVINSFVNPGNSGGPLISMRSGEVIGVINLRSEGPVIGVGMSTMITEPSLASLGVEFP